MLGADQAGTTLSISVFTRDVQIMEGLSAGRLSLYFRLSESKEQSMQPSSQFVSSSLQSTNKSKTTDGSSECYE